MKKLGYLLLSVMLILTLCLCLGSCNEDHTHKYLEEWSSDEDFHWNACESDGCTQKSNKAEHEFEESADAEGNPANVCKVCGYSSNLVNTAGPHDHVFATEYSSSANFHWYSCTTEGCTERQKREEHDFAMPEIIQEANAIKRVYTCSLCGYEKTETTVISSVIEGEASWSQAFENLELVNFDMDVYITHDEWGTQHNHCIVTETGVYYQIPDSIEFYSVKNSDGTCTTYARQYSDIAEGSTLDKIPFYKVPDTSSKYLENAQIETILSVSFKDNYQKFTYDEEKGSYVCAEAIPVKAYLANGIPYPNDMYCFNNEVKVADGKISYISAEYYFVYDDGSTSIEDGVDSSFTYANIGICEVTIPKTVIENAVDDPDYVLHYANREPSPNPEQGNTSNGENVGGGSSDITMGEENMDTNVGEGVESEKYPITDKETPDNN